MSPTTTGGSSPLIFANDDKFDGMNWVTWRGLICIAAEVRGISGYLDRTIKNPVPSAPTTMLQSIAAPADVPGTTDNTPWDLLTPSAAKWKAQNAWAKGLLMFNTKNPIGLGIDILGTAADAWNSYILRYEAASDMACQTAEQDLHNMQYSDNNDFPSHIATICTKWAHTNTLGVDINNGNFKTIILNSLPTTWDPVIASLYCNMSSIEAISQLHSWWICISRNKVTNPA
ncbi:hypothetical protein NP233_g11033 [Leucocoprinus birnbaumii]|uniref:Uncharacterized protein n=1 Tax=Leucocoprinus birnbaumii TaxID=56174 RepID=A0AAD5VHB3_9AGAR|nr:hypothetical protein NP233_g11033 [Leucocoprinus birnbaumii]